MALMVAIARESRLLSQQPSEVYGPVCCDLLWSSVRRIAMGCKRGSHVRKAYMSITDSKAYIRTTTAVSSCLDNSRLPMASHEPNEKHAFWSRLCLHNRREQSPCCPYGNSTRRWIMLRIDRSLQLHSASCILHPAICILYHGRKVGRSHVRDILCVASRIEQRRFMNEDACA